MRTIHEIEQAIRDLGPQDLAALRDWLAAFEPEEVPPLLSEAQRLELARRVAEDDATPEDVIPWEQVKSQALARLQKP